MTRPSPSLRAPPIRRRIFYAATVISEGRRPSRAFDDCFEWGDGAEVVATLRRIAMSDPRLAANIKRYLPQ